MCSNLGAGSGALHWQAPGLSTGRRRLTCEMGIHGVRLLKDDVGEAFNREPHLLSFAHLGPSGVTCGLEIIRASASARPAGRAEAWR